MKTIISLVLIGTVAAFSGCADNNSKPTGAATNVQPSGEQYLAASEPVDAKPVGDARQTVKDGDSVTLVGHIGGSTEPFVNGLAAFTIVDPKIPYCQPDEGCPTPWDYCCTQNDVKDNIATVKVVDEAGKPVAKDARQLLGVKELSLVVVEGLAKRDEQGNLTVQAAKIFVKE